MKKETDVATQDSNDVSKETVETKGEDAAATPDPEPAVNIATPAVKNDDAAKTEDSKSDSSKAVSIEIAATDEKVEEKVEEKAEVKAEVKAEPSPSKPVIENKTTEASKPVSSTASAPATSNTNTSPNSNRNANSNTNSNAQLEETGNVSALFVGRVIGKGGEMIRDLQARSGCRIDVDQNVPEGAPRVITYRGNRRTIDFAKRLIDILCSENGKEADLPLGEASRKHLVVPANVIGKIIGRGGEMIRELQSKSQAKIQVDHTGAGGVDPTKRQITLTGTEQAVVKAEEMIQFLTANPTMDAMQALSMLMDEKNRPGAKWGAGPPYNSMPNGGIGMDNNTRFNQNQSHNQYNNSNNNQQQHGSGSYQQYNNPPNAQYNQPSNSNYGGYPQNNSYNSAPQNQFNPQQNPYNSQPPQQQSFNNGQTESEIFPCPKMYMGRVIGQKGCTINDVQKRSGCDIQINQDVPPGHDCEINIRGSRSGIESAKHMLREIIEMGPNHSYAGGRGNRGGGHQYGGNHQNNNNNGGYNNPQQQYPQNNGYGSQQQYQQQYQPQQQQPPQQPPQQQPPTMQYNNPPNTYGSQGYHPPPQNYAPQQPPQQQQTYPAQQPHQPHQPYMAQGSYGNPGGGGYGQPPMRSPPPMQQVSPWKTATAADGQTYYYNEKTGETQWDKPPGV